MLGFQRHEPLPCTEHLRIDLPKNKPENPPPDDRSLRKLDQQLSQQLGYLAATNVDSQLPCEPRVASLYRYVRFRPAQSSSDLVRRSSPAFLSSQTLKPRTKYAGVPLALAGFQVKRPHKRRASKHSNEVKTHVQQQPRPLCRFRFKTDHE